MATATVKSLKFEPPSDGDDGKEVKILQVTGTHHTYNEFALVHVVGYGLCVVDLMSETCKPVRVVPNDDERKD